MHSLLDLLFRFTFPAFARDWIFLAADGIALATIPSILVRRIRRPLAALSWILAVLAVPFGGVLAWWLLGRTHLQRPMRRRQRSRGRLDALQPDAPKCPPDVPSVIREVLPFALTGDRRWTEGVYPPAEVTGIRVLSSGAEAIAAIESAITGARSDIRALYYIWKDDETGRRLAARLGERAQAGVKVRLLVDETGSRRFLRRVAPGLRAAGVEVVGFLPSRFLPWAPTFNFRNHRKLLLVDGLYAYTGGMNIGTEYERQWNDQSIRLGGPVVRDLDEVFQEDWAFATNRTIDRQKPVGPDGDGDGDRALCTVVASGPDRTEHRVHDGFFLAIAGARRRVWLCSPYFVPSPSLLDALRGAAARGVDVRILTPRQSDVRLVALASRSCHEPLLRAGVRLFEFAPRFLHAKNLIIDEELSVVGSSNVDTRSFRLNFELACFLVSRDVNATLAALFERDLADSSEISRADVDARGMIERCLESGANLLSPLL